MSELLSRLTAACAGRFRSLHSCRDDGAVLEALGQLTEGGEPIEVHCLWTPEVGLDPEALAAALDRRTRWQHPHVLPVLEVGRQAELVWLVWPRPPDAVGLDTWLDRERALPFLEAVRVLRGIAAALVCAHARDCQHLDLRPELVRWRARHAVVQGFGVRQALLEAGLPPDPQDAEGPAADLRALGLLAYEVLTGSPYEPHSSLPSPATRRPHVPPGLARLVVRCLDPDPTRRPADAREVQRLLDALVTPAPGYEAVHLANQVAYLKRRGSLEEAKQREQREVPARSGDVSAPRSSAAGSAPAERAARRRPRRS